MKMWKLGLTFRFWRADGVDLLNLIIVRVECSRIQQTTYLSTLYHMEGARWRFKHKNNLAESSQWRSRTRLNALTHLCCSSPWVPSRTFDNTVVCKFVDECLERFRRWFTSWIADDEEHSLSIAISIGLHYRSRALDPMYLLTHAC